MRWVALLLIALLVSCEDPRFHPKLIEEAFQQRDTYLLQMGKLYKDMDERLKKLEAKLPKAQVKK